MRRAGVPPASTNAKPSRKRCCQRAVGSAHRCARITGRNNIPPAKRKPTTCIPARRLPSQSPGRRPVMSQRARRWILSVPEAKAWTRRRRCPASNITIWAMKKIRFVIRVSRRGIKEVPVSHCHTMLLTGNADWLSQENARAPSPKNQARSQDRRTVVSGRVWRHPVKSIRRRAPERYPPAQPKGTLMRVPRTMPGTSPCKMISPR